MCFGEREQWDRMLALLTFLLLILPFYQGMNRYLLQTYGGASVHQFSAVFLIIDGVAFMAESAIFFAMSRNLSNSRSVYFYCIVLVLLVVDSCWGGFAVQHAGEGAKAAIYSWIMLNVAMSVILGILAYFGSKYSARANSGLIVATAGTVAMFIRTIFDYLISWDFYFS